MAKGQRKAIKLMVGGKLDRISMLPDDLLSCILSKLDTKEAVATSTLSKRWEHIWTFKPDLDFSDGLSSYFKPNKTQSRMFEEYVDNVLFQHDGPVIKKCEFICYAPSSLYAWICAVVCKDVQYLTIRCTTSEFEVQDFPWSVFTCKTLVDLDIIGKFVLNLPSSFCLPNLKTLFLDSVIYGDDASAERLFSSCPSLEMLDIEREKWDGVKRLSISIPSLKLLSIIFSEYTVSRDDADGHETKINAPKLEYFRLEDGTSEDYFLHPSPSLNEACVYSKCVYKVLQGLQYVRKLTLTDELMEYLEDFLREHDLPKFQHLSHLELGLGLNAGWSFLPVLLDSAPNLQVVVFPDGLVVCDHVNYKFFCDFDCYFSEAPHCLLYHLKKVEIKQFAGLPGESEDAQEPCGFSENNNGLP
ncbi:hypothetical protein ACFE04_004920 [Oxalis oulophora]